MPKVTDEYIANKKNFILECMKKLLEEKPLSAITMRDLIKEAGFSQGSIYRYYSSLDEIYVDFINHYTTTDSLTTKIDQLLASESTEIATLSSCFVSMGDYIHEIVKSEVGRAFFELIVLYGNDIEKRESLLPKLIFKQHLGYAQEQMLIYVLNLIEAGVVKPVVPVESIVQFVSVFIDGVAQNIVIANSPCSETTIDIHEMFTLLAEAVTGFLAVNETE